MNKEDRYPVAELNPALLNRIQELEKDLQASSDKEVILIAYEDQKQ